MADSGILHKLMSGQKIIAIIPARGGSKGIPGKNIRIVGGKPLLAWSIEQARQTAAICRVFVSTDSAEIAQVARDYGAEVIQRPQEISGDTASSESCLLHALDFLKHSLNLEPDLVAFLQATSPLRGTEDIGNAIQLLERERADSLFSACRVEGFVWRVDKAEQVRSFSYDHLARPRRQDAPEDLIENGSIYVFKPWVLRQGNNRLGGKIAVYRMPALISFQIDEPADLELIEALMDFRQRMWGRTDPEGIGQTSAPNKLKGRQLDSNHLAIDASARGAADTGQFSVVKLLVLDFDGVLTDNRVIVQQDGTESVSCSRGDGLGIELLKKTGMDIVVISKEKNPVVTARCRKLGIECIQACDDKLTSLKQGAASRNLKPTEIAYVGND